MYPGNCKSSGLLTGMLGTINLVLLMFFLCEEEERLRISLKSTLKTSWCTLNTSVLESIFRILSLALAFLALQFGMMKPLCSACNWSGYGIEIHVWYDITALDTHCLCSWMTLEQLLSSEHAFTHSWGYWLAWSWLLCSLLMVAWLQALWGLLKSPEEQIGVEGKVVISSCEGVDEN